MENYTFRLERQDRETLDALAKKWEMTRSDVVRRLLQEARKPRKQKRLSYEYQRVRLGDLSYQRAVYRDDFEKALDTKLSKLSTEGWQIRAILFVNQPGRTVVDYDLILQRPIVEEE